MAELRGKFAKAQSEKGAIPHISLIIDVRNDSSEPASVIWAKSQVYVHTSPLGLGALVGSGFVSDGWSSLQPIGPKESRKWWINVVLSREVRTYLEKIRKRSDLHLQVKTEALIYEPKNAGAPFRWLELRDEDDNSKLYVSVRVPKSDWEKIWDELSSSFPLFERLKRSALDRTLSLLIDKAWSVLKKTIGMG